jgi:ribosome-associated protein
LKLLQSLYRSADLQALFPNNETAPTMPRSTEATRKGPQAGKPAAKTAKRTSGGATKVAKAAAAKAPATKLATATKAATGSRKRASSAPEVAGGELATAILKWLDDAKAEDIVALDIRGKTTIGDCMIVASGRSDRHVGAIADQLQKQLKAYGASNVRVEGTRTCDWVLVDVGAVVVNLFRPDVRIYYNLEKMWSSERPGEVVGEAAGEAGGDATH